MPSSRSDWILAIDNGTQSVRALVIDLEGQIIAKSQVKLTPYFSRQPGWCEQDPSYYWQSLVDCLQHLWKQGVDRSRIKGVSVTTQRGTIFPIDENLNALRPAILWLDQRKAHRQHRLNLLWQSLFKVAGASKTIDALLQKAQPNWIFQFERDIWDKTHKFVYLSGFFHAKLTGELSDSIGSQVGYLPFDYQKQDWAAPFAWQWQALNVKKGHLVNLLQPTETVGVIHAKAAEETGIPQGLPVIASAADKACEVLGSGALEEHIGCLSFGTTATINVTTPRYFEAIRFMPPFPAAIPQHYCAEVMLYRGFWMVSWFKEQFGLYEAIQAKAQGLEAEMLFDELVNAVPAGSMGLMLQPYWGAGVKKPGPEAKGAVIGFGDVHTRAHLYRAILEGLAFGLKEGLSNIEKKGKLKVNALRVSGGGSQSSAAVQIAADIFGLPVTRPHTYETSGLGAAMNTAIGLGYYSDHQSAIQSMVHARDTFTPQPNNEQLYQALYEEVYLKMYTRLKPIYQKIQEITGYPEV
ncbi:FGGY-family carbohydrate kinase [Algicola sagamiensis]|uniref:FGGY-family carbohydrate kinase n=1 Tax=Algicola sagamiensis TaxID=163869 RepID=UPI000376869B|nr:FGGY-family carbohydrate kinase [Algicola sagamiensis]